MTIRKIVFIICISFTVSNAKAQSDSTLHNRITKNILLYHIRHSSDGEMGLSMGGFLHENESNFYKQLFNKADLGIKITPDSSLSYPLQDYQLYRVYKRNFNFTDGKLTKSMQLPSFFLDDDYLVAYKEKTRQIKFLSGNFFLSRFSHDFALDTSNPKNYYDFLKLKLYQYDIDELVFVRQDAKDFFYNATSKRLKRKVEIVVNKEDNDVVKVIYTNKIEAAY